MLAGEITAQARAQVAPGLAPPDQPKREGQRQKRAEQTEQNSVGVHVGPFVKRFVLPLTRSAPVLARLATKARRKTPFRKSAPQDTRSAIPEKDRGTDRERGAGGASSALIVDQGRFCFRVAIQKCLHHGHTNPVHDL